MWSSITIELWSLIHLVKQHFRWTQIVKTRNVEKYTKYACGYSDDHNVGFPKKNIMVMVWVGLAEQGIVLGTQGRRYICRYLCKVIQRDFLMIVQQFYSISVFAYFLYIFSLYRYNSKSYKNLSSTFLFLLLSYLFIYDN